MYPSQATLQLRYKKSLVSPNTPNTLVRCIGALVRQRDSEIQVILMIISGNCNLK
jgi:hypothetical protein